MWYDVSWAPSPQSSAALVLAKLYEVRADASYDIHPDWTLQSTFVAVRTLSGKGILDSGQGESFQLTRGTLLIVPWKEIRRFRCPGKAWHFWWFEFHPVATLPLPSQRLMELPVSQSELASLKSCFSDLRQNGPRFQSRASSRLVLLLHDWAAEWTGDVTSQTRHQVAVQRVVQLMHDHLQTRLGLPEMAHAAGLSERRFRQVFAQLTGKSPKRFYEELRLRKAADHLRFHDANVSEISEEFGYSSPFHFSKAFRSFFGVPPLRYLGKHGKTI